MDFFLYILALLMCTKYFKVINKNPIIIGIREINKVYSDICNERKPIIRVTGSLLLFLSELSCYLSIYYLLIKYMKRFMDLSKMLSIEYAIIVAAFIIFHYIIGYVLLISSNFHRFMYKDAEQSIQASFLFSYFLTSIFLVCLMLGPKLLERYVLCGILSIFISYFINLYILFKIMRNPRCIKMNEQDNSSFIKVLLAALIIISMLVINLYLLACLVNMLGSNVFSNNPNCFDLFYYTVVSFITLGSSDIIPLSVTAKLITILISFSSFYCISLFLGVLYSHSKK